MGDRMCWMQELYYVCPVCGSKIPDGDCGEMIKGSDEKGLIMRCPDCGSDSTLLQEYW